MSSQKQSIFFKTVRMGTRSLASWERLCLRSVSTLSSAMEGFLLYALAAEEKAQLGIDLYETSLRRANPERGLWKWEKEWIQKSLPKPPARILLGAAGTGREAVTLCQMGYQLDAFEPAPKAAQACAERVGHQGQVIVGSYEHLSRAVIDRSGGPLAALADRAYDGIILGWGSLSHILSDAERFRLLKACSMLGKDAPILTSFWINWMDQQPPFPSKARNVGFQMGRLFAELRGVHEPYTYLQFGNRFGFGHSFSKEEIELLANYIGREVRWGVLSEYPHATFVPKLNG